MGLSFYDCECVGIKIDAGKWCALIHTLVFNVNAMGLCVSKPFQDELYPLVKKWLPEYITYYGDIDPKYYCPFGVFLGGFVEYIAVIQKYRLDGRMHLDLRFLEYMVMDVLSAIYPNIVVKGGCGGGGVKRVGKDNKIETRYMSGIRMKCLP